jgi:hypothetical protein
MHHPEGKRLVEKQRLVELLGHGDERVRDAAVRALAKSFPDSEGVIEHLLRVIEGNIKENVTLALYVKDFIPTDNDVKNIVKLIVSTELESEEESSNVNYHLKSSLLEFPLEILKRHRQAITFNKNLKDLYRTASQRDKLKRKSPDYLWQELETLCRNYQDKKMPHEDHQYASLLIDGLAHYKEEIKPRVIMHLSQETMDNYYLEEFLVKLAGRLRLTEAVPFLVRILKQSDFLDWVNQECAESLGKIGTPEVVRQVESICKDDPELAGRGAEILRCIPYDFAEDTAIRLLERERDLGNKTFFAMILCDIFSIKASALVLDMIQKRQYDPAITTLIDQLLPVYVYHGKDTDSLSALEKEDRRFGAETLHKNPLYQAVQKLREDLESDFTVDNEEDEDENQEDSPPNVVPLRKIPSAKKRKPKSKKKKKH